MKKRYLIIILFSILLVIVLSACSNMDEMDHENNGHGTSIDEKANDAPIHAEHGISTMDDEMDHENNGHGASIDEEANDVPVHAEHGDTLSLTNTAGINEILIPRALKSEDSEKTVYTIRAQSGKTEIYNGYQTETLGYNGGFLGPMIKFKTGETIKINLINDLNKDTTFHWHGLEVSDREDGGPHSVLKPGEERTIEFEVTQEASTLWFHPHPKENTAEQVYKGLTGLIYIEDENSSTLNLPDQYGENDIPLIFQDKVFNDNKQLNYEKAKNSDGTVGDTLLINGTVDPKLSVNKEKVRLRLLNGSNARNFTFKLNSNENFVQIATDGGLLNEPVLLKELTLTPSERAEIIVDFSKIEDDIFLVNEDGIELLKFEVSDYKGEENTLPIQMNDFLVTEKEKSLPVTKEIELFGMMDMVTINGKKFDPERIDFEQKKGITEIWEVYNKPDEMGGMIHPFHIHGAQFKIVSRNGENPPKNEQGWKDSFSVAPDETVKIAIQFKYPGTYMFHCHILEHEDNGMMGQVKVK